MAFQFLCPQGHLLQGEESQAGQPCQCPMCGVQFLIPSPMPGPSPGAQPPPPGPSTFGPPPGQPAFGPQQPPPGHGFAPGPSAPGPSAPGPQLGEAYPSFQPEAGVLPQVGPGAAPVAPGEIPHFGGTSAPAALVHIVCPSGHTLETPREMLGEDAMCPFCQVAFRLRWEDSIEYRQAKEAEMLRREQRLGKAWLQWSIAIAVVVIGGLIALVAMTLSR